MRTAAILVGLLLNNSNAVAGSRTINCDGKLVDMSVQAKGAHPYPAGADIAIVIEGKSTTAKPIFHSESRGSYDFNIVYQSLESGYMAILQSVQTDLILFVFQSGNLIEKVVCNLDF
jgi:hypothetical protein